MLTVTVILIDLEKGYYICLVTKIQTKEMRLHKTATALKKFHYSILTPTIDKEPQK